FTFSPHQEHTIHSKKSELILCDLIRDSKLYDGKEIRFRATYLSTFEHSAFVDGRCTDREHLTCVEFDNAKIEASTTPEVLEKVKAQILCCVYAGFAYFRETNVVVTGVFVSSPNRATSNGKYGHDSMYRFLVTVKSVHKVEPTKTITMPGFDP